MTTTALVLAAMLVAQAPIAESPAASASGTQSAKVGVTAKDKTICKRVTIRGSRFTERKCASADQWEQQRRHNVEITREMQGSDGSSKAGT